MIHTLQCLCPERHAIFGVMYDDELFPPEIAQEGLETLVEELIKHRMLNRRCEICNKGVTHFLYEDKLAKSQTWDEAKIEGQEMEAEQALIRMRTIANRARLN